MITSDVIDEVKICSVVMQYPVESPKIVVRHGPVMRGKSNREGPNISRKAQVNSSSEV